MVSILVPSYNHAAFLRECLDSVLAQSYQDWEVLVFDDYSTDDSYQIAQEYAARDGRIRAFRNDVNLGTYGTQQAALEMSGGEFVAILNSDDIWLPNKLQAQVTALQHDATASFTFTLGWMVNEHGVVDMANDVHADWPREGAAHLLPWLLTENRILASSVVFRREGLQFNTTCRYSGDWVGLLEASLRGPAAIVGERLTHWRQHSTNTYRQSIDQVLEEIVVRNAIVEAEPQWQASVAGAAMPDLVEEKLVMNVVNLQALLVASYAMSESRMVIRAAKRRWPEHPIVHRRWLLSWFPAEVQRRRLWKDVRLARPIRPSSCRVNWGSS